MFYSERNHFFANELGGILSFLLKPHILERFFQLDFEFPDFISQLIVVQSAIV